MVMMNLMSNNPSVLFVDQSGELGGAELSLFDLVRLRPGFSSVALFEDGPFREKLDNAAIPVQLMPLLGNHRIQGGSGLGAALKASPAIIRQVLKLAGRARNFELLYANTQKAFVISAIAAKLARRPLIWHLRDILTADHFSSTTRSVAVRLANSFADCVIANSASTAEGFRAAGGKAEIRVVHNGIPSDAFDSIDGEAAQQRLRGELGWHDLPIIGVFSRLDTWKGQHVLVEALRQLPDVRAIFVGGALFEKDAYATQLRARISELGLEDRCRILGFRSDIPALMKGVDIVAHTSIAPEPFGRVVVEGMLAGRPVIATRAGGVVEIIDDGTTGLLTEPGNIDDLAQAIRRLIASPDYAAQIAAAGARAAKNRFSIETLVSQVNAIIREIATQ